MAAVVTVALAFWALRRIHSLHSLGLPIRLVSGKAIDSAVSRLRRFTVLGLDCEWVAQSSNPVCAPRARHVVNQLVLDQAASVALGGSSPAQFATGSCLPSAARCSRGGMRRPMCVCDRGRLQRSGCRSGQTAFLRSVHFWKTGPSLRCGRPLPPSPPPPPIVLCRCDIGRRRD